VGLVVLASLFILPLFGVDWTALAAVAGAVGLAISLSFQDLFRNFIAGIYILGERPFTLGDRITVQTTPAITGTVESIELRITTMRSEEGVLVVVPNNTLFTTPFTNHTAVDLQRDMVEVCLTTADLGAARAAINTVLAGVAGLAASPQPSITVEEATPSTLRLQVEFWTPPASARQTAPLVVEALRARFPDAEVTVLS
jgi:small-conductance mechanosensitive channel